MIELFVVYDTRRQRPIATYDDKMQAKEERNRLNVDGGNRYEVRKGQDHRKRGGKKNGRK